MVRSKPRDPLIAKYRTCTQPFSAMDASSPSSATRVRRLDKVILARLPKGATARILDSRSRRRANRLIDRTRAPARDPIRHGATLARQCKVQASPDEELGSRIQASADR